LGLIKAVIHLARQQFDNIEIGLEVIPGNNSAYRLYKKAGFEEITDESDKEPGNSIMMKYRPDKV
jgi:ribosomal protein S18 acetylase RimI-like enzyme